MRTLGETIPEEPNLELGVTSDGPVFEEEPVEPSERTDEERLTDAVRRNNAGWETIKKRFVPGGPGLSESQANEVARELYERHAAVIEAASTLVRSALRDENDPLAPNGDSQAFWKAQNAVTARIFELRDFHNSKLMEFNKRVRTLDQAGAERLIGLVEDMQALKARDRQRLDAKYPDEAAALSVAEQFAKKGMLSGATKEGNVVIQKFRDDLKAAYDRDPKSVDPYINRESMFRPERGDEAGRASFSRFDKQVFGS